MRLGESRRWDASQAAVRPHLVAVAPPGNDRCTGLRQRLEPLLVQALVAQLAVEALDEGVLRRLAGIDEQVSDFPLDCAQPMKVRLVNSGPSAARTSLGSPRNTATGSSRRVTYWPGMPKSTPISTHSCVKSSATVSSLIRRPLARLSAKKSMLQISLIVRAAASGCRSPLGCLGLAPPAHGQLHLAVQAIDTLGVDLRVLGAPQVVDAPVAEAAPHMRQFDDLAADVGVQGAGHGRVPVSIAA